MRFYANENGTISCRCGDNEVVCGDNYSTSEMLVTTDLTRQVRPKIIDAMVNKKIYCANGPAGTGKTETCKDTMRFLGMEALVVSCSDKGLDAQEVLKMWRDDCEKSGKNCGVIFDECNRMTSDVTVPLIKAIMDEGIFVCCTFNPGFKGDFGMEWIKENNIPHNAQEFTVPPRTQIMQAMLATEGILDCDTIGAGFSEYFQACEQKLSKQRHYDFGLRNHKSLCGLIGRRLRQSNDWSNEKQSMANFIAEIQNLRLLSDDKPISTELLKEHLCEAAAEKEMTLGQKVAFMASVRHGVAILGNNFNAEEVQKLQKEIDEAMNATSMNVPYATTSEAFNPVDGNVVMAFKQSANETGNFNMYFSGEQKVQPCQYFENLNTVLDDNKLLCTTEPETRYPLKNNVRCIFFVDNTEGFSPATVSRLGWINY